MGTSTSQRSPDTAAWRRVRELYRRGPLSGGIVLGAIARAVTRDFLQDMAGEAPAACLAAIVRNAPPAQLRAFPSPNAYLRFYESTRSSMAQSTSRQGELALEAASRVCLRGAPEDEPTSRVKEFLGQYLAATFAYLCARDASDFVGGETLRTVADEHDLLDQVRDLALEAGRAAQVSRLVELCLASTIEVQKLRSALLATITAVFRRLRKERPSG